jgi:hypothetical protein
MKARDWLLIDQSVPDPHEQRRAQLEPLCKLGIETAEKHGLHELGEASRWLLRALDARAPDNDVLAAAMTMAWHFGRHDGASELKRIARWWLDLRAAPRRRGGLKAGATKREPAEVRARYGELVASGKAPKAAKDDLKREFGISLATLNRYFKS